MHDDFASSPEGIRLRASTRFFNRLRLNLPLEPKSKQAMGRREKENFQNLIIAEMKRQKRTAFRGRIAAKLWLSATAPNPPHLYKAIKNLLDLFGSPLAKNTRRKGLVYFDDSQLWALSVAYRVKAETPGVHATFAPLSHFIQDIALASDILSGCLPHSGRIAEEVEEDEPNVSAIDKYLDLRRDDWWAMDDTTFDAIARWNKYEAQRALLNQTRLGIRNLSNLYASSDMLPRDPVAMYPEIVAVRSEIADSVKTSRLRVGLPRPPEKEGDTVRFREEADRAIEEFEREFHPIWQPLLTPIALEVAYKPVLGSNQPVRDLDNLMRYVLSRFNERFKPPSNVSKAWAPAPNESQSNTRGLPPKSIEYSIVRLDVFQFSRRPSDASEGFFVVGLAPHMSLSDNLWTKADEIIEKWRDASSASLG